MNRLSISFFSLVFLLGGCAQASSASSFHDDVPELDNAKELEIKIAYAKKYEQESTKEVKPEQIVITGYYGEYHGSYVMFINPSFVDSLFMITKETIGNYVFVYSTTLALSVYHDGDFCSVTEAASSFLSKSGLNALYARYSTANEYLYK
jgi:hypothetical protein